jgi:predicted amidohydrolase YtcJ
MKNKLRISIAALLMVCVTLVMVSCGTTSADLLITNATVETVDAAGTVAEAVAVADGKIIFVGDAAEAEGYVDNDTKIIDMNGGTVMPGMVDSHMHPAMSAAAYMYEISLHTVTADVDSYLEVIEKFVDEHPDLDVYSGAGFMRSVFDTVGPRKEMLDAISPDKPIILTSVDGHSLWANSKALEMAGITKATPNPEGGVIQHDPKSGEPSGLLQESAKDLVADLQPEYTKQQYKDAILWLQD